MDPNTTLTELRKYAIGETDQWALLFEALDNWLTRGGFLPRPWQQAQDEHLAAVRAAINRDRS